MVGVKLWKINWWNCFECLIARGMMKWEVVEWKKDAGGD
jgi:hypothetical protein